MEVSKLYPQYNQKPDRRQNNLSVDSEQRSGMDRRVSLDSDLRQDIKQVKDVFEAFRPSQPQINSANTQSKTETLFLKGVLSCVPALRRIDSIENNKDNNIKAVGLGALAVINLKEDFRDILSVVGLAKSEAPEGFKPVFKFCNGTIIETWLRKTQKGKEFLNNVDTTLADTIFVNKYINKKGIKWDKHLYDKSIKYPFINKSEKITRQFVKYDGKISYQVLLHSLNRITKLGLIFAGLLEIPTITKSIKHDKDYKQIAKSAINIVSYASLGALFSATGAVFAGSAGSVLGLGFGFFVGNHLAKSFNSKI